jgi:Tol biopolymer transport system component
MDIRTLDRVALVVLATLAVACTEPDVRTPAALAVLSGNGQEAEVSAELPIRVAVQVTDSFGRPVPRVVVNFQVSLAPGPGFSPGSVSPATVETNVGGVASARWTLGTWAGGQTLRAWIGSAEDGATPQVEAHATARPGVAASLVRVSDPVVAITVGDSVQVAVIGADRYGNPTSTPTNVTWQVLDPSVAFVSRSDVPPDRAAMVVARARGTAVLEARDPAAGTVRFELRTYVGPGRDIAYESNGNIYVMSADGATTTPLGLGREPAWSPDGRLIAFTGVVGTGFAGAIHVMNADGSGRRALTDPATLGSASQPTWSPDGRNIAFVAPSNEPPGATAIGALFVMNADGSAPTRVLFTLNLCSILCPGPRYPTWSPDGTRIAYSLASVRSTGARGDVFVVNADGSGDRALVSTGEFEAEPAWSPDGRRVVFKSSPICCAAVQILPGDLYSVNADGSGRTRLTTGSSTQSSDISPTWSPDDRIAFVRVGPAPVATPFPLELWVVNGDGTEARRVARFDSGITRPAWRPTP